MPVHADSEYETVSLVLTKEQTRRLRAMSEARTTRMRKVKISEVGREVVEAGLGQFDRARNTGFDTSLVTDNEGRAA